MTVALWDMWSSGSSEMKLGLQRGEKFPVIFPKRNLPEMFCLFATLDEIALDLLHAVANSQFILVVVE